MLMTPHVCAVHGRRRLPPSCSIYWESKERRELTVSKPHSNACHRCILCSPPSLLSIHNLLYTYIGFIALPRVLTFPGFLVSPLLHRPILLIPELYRSAMRHFERTVSLAVLTSNSYIHRHNFTENDRANKFIFIVECQQGSAFLGWMRRGNMHFLFWRYWLRYLPTSAIQDQ